MKISYKDKDLIDSECFITFGQGETRIELSYENDSLSLILDFVSDDTKQQKHLFEKIDVRTLKIHLTNWDQPLGMGFVQPIEVGTLMNRKLYFLLWVRKAGDKSDFHEVTFSAYLGEVASNG